MSGGTICIIQARMGSQRLPEKVLSELSGEPVISHVIRRVKAISSVDHVIAALPKDARNDPLAKAVLAAGADVFRGSEDDVLARYYFAAEAYQPDYVMRVTADCPLLDPWVCDNLVQHMKITQADYGGNGGFPHGLDCELMSFKALKLAHKTATHPHDREHVTLWLKRQTDIKVAHLTCDHPHDQNNRWTLDYPEDKAFMEALFDLLPPPPTILPWQDVLAIVDKHPDLRNINAGKATEWAAATKTMISQVTQSDAQSND